VSLHQKKKPFDNFVDSLKSWKHKYVVLRPLNRRVHTSICQVPLDNLEDRSDSEVPDSEGTGGSEADFVADWPVQNRDPGCGGGSSGVSSSHAEVEHVPLFSHFWSREH